MNNKQRLFEVMGKLDNTFSMLNQNAEKNEYNDLTINEEMASNSDFLSIKKFVIFAFNYPNNFIEKVWIDDPNLVDHLKNKFHSIYDRNGAKAVMNSFFVELDTENQRKLIDWMMINYAG